MSVETPEVVSVETPEVVSVETPTKDNKDNINKLSLYGSNKNVKLSQGEYNKLVKRFGEQGILDRIENLSLYLASKGKTYKDYYATILRWELMDNKQGIKQDAKPKGRYFGNKYMSPEEYRKQYHERVERERKERTNGKP